MLKALNNLHGILPSHLTNEISNEIHGYGLSSSSNSMDGKIEKATQLGSCKCTSILPFVACIVKQCRPNGQGDMQISIKVAAFSPRSRLCFINITVWNIVKIFKADICEPTDELVHATLKPDIVLHPSMDPKVDDLLQKLMKPPTITNNTDHGQGSSTTHGSSSSTQGAPTTNQDIR
ncbi:hypothetical protein DEO72_LG6g982 [Vigna unguiculata]|uniref:Uncharacterized protein n=1 Tax=Vigna unguiculata TaxID=3917 RepID=A0A4D6M6I1_VIGUN|nr:hypothetical protein DEO72_LG6g982 [Vigna unguiculata]